jgi:putative transposase
MKGAEFLTQIRLQGVKASNSRPGVSDDYPFSESLFKTMKYRTWYPEKPFINIGEAKVWMTRFVTWYNNSHLHSGLKFVTPAQRHKGQDKCILEKRNSVYIKAKKLHPERWSKTTRNWIPDRQVVLNGYGKLA